MNWKSRSTWITILVTAFIAWLLNRTLDMTATGATLLWGKLLFVITLGSATVRDAPFASAALNPYPLTPILLSQLMTYVVAGALGVISGYIYSKFRSNNELHKAEETVTEHSRSASRRKWIKKYFAFVILISPIALLLASVVPFGIVNQAVFARRVYEADRDILAPHLTSQQIAEIQSQFCSIKTKSQYKELLIKLNSIASANNVKLRVEGSKF